MYSNLFVKLRPWPPRFSRFSSKFRNEQKYALFDQTKFSLLLHEMVRFFCKINTRITGVLHFITHRKDAFWKNLVYMLPKLLTYILTKKLWPGLK